MERLTRVDFERQVAKLMMEAGFVDTEEEARIEIDNWIDELAKNSEIF
jgi:hypothetical protein